MKFTMPEMLPTTSWLPPPVVSRGVLTSTSKAFPYHASHLLMLMLESSGENAWIWQGRLQKNPRVFAPNRMTWERKANWGHGDTLAEVALFGDNNPFFQLRISTKKRQHRGIQAPAEQGQSQYGAGTKLLISDSEERTQPAEFRKMSNKISHLTFTISVHPQSVYDSETLLTRPSSCFPAWHLMALDGISLTAHHLVLATGTNVGGHLLSR